MNKILSLSNINPNLLRLQYAVRGPIVIRAMEIEKELASGAKKHFNSVVKCNIGDCQATGQTPITFLRQIVALTILPSMFDEGKINSDVKERAKRILNSCEGESIGSYSNSIGIESVRSDIVEYIYKRDGLKANSDDIFLSNGASEAIKAILFLISGSEFKKSGVMLPIPQYPLYSATADEYNLFQIGYYLNEENGWGLERMELEEAIYKAKKICLPRAITVINPGNPTGQVLTRSCMEDVIRFAKKHRLIILADEVYQHNVYDPEHYPWLSMKRILHEMGPGYSDCIELASFMSVSKGYMGECGLRGGYCELVNFDPDVKAQLYKYLSARLCPSVVGQVAMSAVCNPPIESESSYNMFVVERDSILKSLEQKAKIVTDTLNTLPGITCTPLQGSMYAFARIVLPKKAIAAAKKCKMEPDFFYCMNLLESKGICFVPGSGFGQKNETYHFRTTILPPIKTMKYVMNELSDFHQEFLRKYS